LGLRLRTKHLTSLAPRSACFAALVFILAAGVVLRVRPYLFNRSLWMDEAMLARNVVGRSFSELAAPLDYAQGAPLGFLWASKALIEVLGNRDYILRLVPLISGLVALFLFARLLGKLDLGPSICVALAVYAVGAQAVYYSTEFKQYSSDALVTLLLLTAAMPGLRGEERPRDDAMLAAIGVLSLWASHPAVFVVSGIFAALFVERLRTREARGLLRLAGMGLALTVSFGLVYLLAMRKLVGQQVLVDFWRGAFLPLPPWANLAWIKTAMTEMFVNPVGLTLPVVGLLLMVAGSVRQLRLHLPTALALLLPLLLALAASGLQAYPFHSRMLLFAVPPILVLVAQGMEAVRLALHRTPAVSVIAWAILAGLLVVGPIDAAVKTFAQPQEGEQVRPAVQYLAAHWQAGDTLYVYYSSYHAWAYYAPSVGLDVSDHVIIGRYARNEPEKYREDIQILPRQGRVWMLFSHVHTGSQGNEEDLILRQLDGLGQLTNEQHYPYASLYLFMMGV